jgi:CubicO group peptidase (beta-lactamase class C family)
MLCNREPYGSRLSRRPAPKLTGICALAIALLGSEGGARDAAKSSSDDWSRSRADSLGINTSRIDALDRDIKSGHYPLVDNLLVIRCGAIGFEGTYTHDYAKIYGTQARTPSPLSPPGGGPYNYFDVAWHPYLPGTDLHTMQSISKSVTSVILGVAMQRGDFKAGLDTPVLHYFKEQSVRAIDDRKRRLTLRHLLTMTSGLDWPDHGGYTDPENATTQMEASQDWVQFVINRPMAHEPGTNFVYSDGDTELLAYIFQNETGHDLGEYGQRYLFAPLGIHSSYWKRTPLGVVNTEGGLYLRAQDIAKIGLLYLHNGSWNGQQIVSADWVRQSLTPAIEVGNGRQYGFQWWLQAHGPADDPIWAGHGFGGQGLIVDPKRSLILVITGWDIPRENNVTQKEVLERVVDSASKDSCARVPPT